jgi:hypothetical protein
MKNVFPLLFVTLFACSSADSVTASPAEDAGSTPNDASTQDVVTSQDVSLAVLDAEPVVDSGQAVADVSEGGSGVKDSSADGARDAGKAEDAGIKDSGTESVVNVQDTGARDASRDAISDAGDACDKQRVTCYEACAVGCENDCKQDCDDEWRGCEADAGSRCSH